jgi:hypothetical protein
LRRASKKHHSGGAKDRRRSACVLVCLLGRQVMVKIAADSIAAR